MKTEEKIREEEARSNEIYDAAMIAVRMGIE